MMYGQDFTVGSRRNCHSRNGREGKKFVCHSLCEVWRVPRMISFWRRERDSNLRRFAGVSQAGACRRNPERSEGPAVSNEFGLQSGGGRGIRTPGTLSGTAVFKTARFDRSRIPPDVSFQQFTSIHSSLKPATVRILQELQPFAELDRSRDTKVLQGLAIPPRWYYRGTEL